MLPKKIYLNYVDENDDEKTWSEEPVSVTDCDLHNREYTDLSQVWHDASEEPQESEAKILYHMADGPGVFRVTYGVTTLHTVIAVRHSWQNWARINGLCKWAYIADLLPKRI